MANLTSSDECGGATAAAVTKLGRPVVTALFLPPTLAVVGINANVEETKDDASSAEATKQQL
jgi:hypothetical protein